MPSRPRGERKINRPQARTFRHIFNEYAQGKSPRAIAIDLNGEGVPGPSGKAWGPSTIHGNRQRGTGIPNTEIYIGRLIRNRLRYIKDPDTGKRVSRLNPESEWIIRDVPELRITDVDLWAKVKARQASIEGSEFGEANKGHIDRRIPRYQLSGLMTCHSCGGGVINLNSARVGCANTRNKGTCDNQRTMRREVLESLVLDGLKEHSMDPALCELFCEEYTREINRLRREAGATVAGMKNELAKVNRDLERLVQATSMAYRATRSKTRWRSSKPAKRNWKRSWIRPKKTSRSGFTRIWRPITGSRSKSCGNHFAMKALGWQL